MYKALRLVALLAAVSLLPALYGHATWAETADGDQGQRAETAAVAVTTDAKKTRNADEAAAAATADTDEGHATDEAVAAASEDMEVFPEAEAEDPAVKADTNVLNGNHDALNVRVTSWRDLPFQTVRKQSFDYSCGSAAVATLLSYVYGEKTSEEAVFKAMFDAGDKDKIRREGFSLLDMRNYLAKRGYKAAGYKIGFSAIAKHKVPFIALINRDGYSHFVVVKSVTGPSILIGDPSRGNIVLSRGEFAKMWNGISLIVTNQARKARKIFADAKEWHYSHASGNPNLGEQAGIDSVDLPFPNWQIAPAGFDILSVVNTTTVN